jgi:uncharacterized protein YbbC (DUF1343 family)
MVRTGNDIITREAARRLGRKRIGLLANPASVDSKLVHIADLLSAERIRLECIFGPQHGYRGETQANMIEWQGYLHPELGIPVYSLYGEKREPDAFMIQDLDTVLIDLPDVGARPYTYIWTALLMMRASAAAGIPVTVCDRPNPIGGSAVEGPLLDGEYASFVGLHPLPMRHGLTIGEALGMMNETHGVGCELEVIRMRGWERSMYYEETEQPWIMPSPNMPSPDTAVAYPGGVLLEGTNISEGRGTTRPFELAGAPWIEPLEFARKLSSSGIEGAIFRPVHFMPAWDKYEGQICGGVQIHVTRRKTYRPVRCYALLIAAAAALYPEHFAWAEPPYEYEFELPPIDVISGGSSLRETIDAGRTVHTLFDAWKRDERNFSRRRRPFLLY